MNGRFDNKSEKGGRPNIDEVLMIKSLFLQEMYGLSDPQLEYQITDRISFRRFLGILGVPDAVPDFSTFWKFRERLATTGKHKVIWKEFQRQLDSKGLKVKKGVIQDATFITSDPGHAKADTPRGDEAKTRRSKDGTWVKKGQKSFFGYKLHSKSDVEYGLIREIKTTTASLHDSQVDLSFRKEVVYRDKGYFGDESSGWSATMERSVRGHPIGIRSKLRNIRISRIRSPGERPYSVIKRTFGSGHVMIDRGKGGREEYVRGDGVQSVYHSYPETEGGDQLG